MHHFILLPPRSVQLLRRVARVTAAWQQTFLAWAGPLPAQTRRTCKMFANCTFAASSVVTSLWIIVTEWDLELWSSLKHCPSVFLQTRRWHFLENAIRLWLHCPPAGCSCVPMFAVLARDGDGNISRQILTVPHLAGGRDHAHTGTVSLHSLGVLKLLSNFFDDCNFLIWKRSMISDVWKAGSFKTKIPSARPVPIIWCRRLAAGARLGPADTKSKTKQTRKFVPIITHGPGRGRVWAEEARLQCSSQCRMLDGVRARAVNKHLRNFTDP